MKKVILSALIGASLSISAVVQAHPGPRIQPPAMQFIHPLRDLSLTDEQQQQIRALVSDFTANRMLSSRAAADTRLETLLALSDDERRTQVRQRFEQRQQRAFETATLRHEIYTLLDASQRLALTEHTDDTASEHRKPRHRKPKSLFRALDLSDEQRASMAALRQQQHQLDEAFEGMMEEFRAAERDLIHSDAFTYERWLSTLEEHRAELLDLAQSRDSNRRATLNVLTEQQQQLLITLRKVHKKQPRHPRG